MRRRGVMRKGFVFALVAASFAAGLWLGAGALREPIVRAQTERRTEVLFDDFDLTSTTMVYSSSQTGAAEEGWVTVANEFTKAVEIRVNTINATSIDCLMEGRLFQATQSVTTEAQIWPASGNVSFTATGSQIVEIPDTLWQLRVGCKVTGDTGAQELTVLYNWFPGR
jgi:hypothetical protein